MFNINYITKKYNKGIWLLHCLAPEWCCSASQQSVEMQENSVIPRSSGWMWSHSDKERDSSECHQRSTDPKAEVQNIMIVLVSLPQSWFAEKKTYQNIYAACPLAERKSTACCTTRAIRDVVTENHRRVVRFHQRSRSCIPFILCRYLRGKPTFTISL